MYVLSSVVTVALIIQGYVRHNWKTRWFVLFNDALCYYKKKEVRLRNILNEW